MKIEVIVGDITRLQVDAIVNAANSSLLGGGGVDGAIHRAAGPGLLAECRGLNGCRVGQCKVTAAYNLPCKYIIHTVGPNCRVADQNARRRELLSDCYRNCMNVVKDRGLKSIAFCCISTGVYGYPKVEAAQLALDVIRSREYAELDCNVTICCFSSDDKAVYDSLLC